LVEKGKQYAIYFEKANAAVYILQIPDGNYSAEYVNGLTGNVVKTDVLKVVKGSATMAFAENEDIAIRILKQ